MQARYIRIDQDGELIPISTNQKGKPTSKDLLLYFNGWAMNQAAVAHLILPTDTDLVVCGDYRDLDFLLPFSPSDYRRISLVAWSMGVWAAEKLWVRSLLPPIDQAVAIAGTAYPMDDLYGIPDATFRATLAGLNDENRERFNRRMCGGKSLKHLFDALRERPTQEIRDELAYVYRCVCADRQVDKEPCDDSTMLPWDKAYVPLRDKIVPPDNQMRYWQRRNITTITLEASEHYLMRDFDAWSELL